MRGLTITLLLISICHHESGAVKCNDGCAVVTRADRKDVSQNLPKGYSKFESFWFDFVDHIPR
jgi:hypothetical protein